MDRREEREERACQGGENCGLAWKRTAKDPCAHAREEGAQVGAGVGKRAIPSLVFSTICGRRGPTLGLIPSLEALGGLDSLRIPGRVGH